MVMLDPGADEAHFVVETNAVLLLELTQTLLDVLLELLLEQLDPFLDLLLEGLEGL